MSSNRLIEFLKEQFRDPDIEKICIETSVRKILDNDCTRVFDKFPELFEKNDPRIKWFSDHLNVIYNQLYNNQHDTLSHYPVESNVLAWLTKIAEMGRHELLNHDGSIKFRLVQLLKWNHIYHSIDTHKLLQAYVSMVLPKIMICASESANINSDEYGAIILNYSNKLSSKYIHDALYPDDGSDFSFLIPIGISAAAVLGGLLTWSIFSEKKKPSRNNEVELEEKSQKKPN